MGIERRGRDRRRERERREVEGERKEEGEIIEMVNFNKK